ncbi:MAG: sugar-binding protein, partial [candidate division WOR-3 bacterium]
MNKNIKNTIYILFILFILFLVVNLFSQQYQVVNARITVSSGEMQTLYGFGVSNVGLYYNPPSWGYKSLTSSQKGLLNNLIFKDARFKVLRLWFSYDVASFYSAYIESGIINDAKNAGCEKLLLAPSHIPGEYLSNNYMRTEMIGEWANRLAESIRQIRDNYGVLIDYTEIVNEPDGVYTGNHFYIAPSQWPLMVKALRTALDSRNLPTGIIAPSNANCDGYAEDFARSIRDDSNALNALYAFATHSYNMAATPSFASIVGNKEYWMTEASSNGPQDPNDTSVATSGAARVFNDFNNRVTCWIWFIGFELEDQGDNATRLIKYLVNPFSYTLHPQYYYLKHIATNFDSGCVFRKCTISGFTEPDGNLDPNMTYTYGKKPMINATAARNPDGSWVIGIVNHTSIHYSDNPGGQDGWYARIFNIDVDIEELRGQTKVFYVSRSGPSGYQRDDGSVEMVDGVVRVNNIYPQELVILKSESSGGANTVSLNVKTNPTNAGNIVLNPSGGIYAIGSTVTLTALSNPGWEFYEWSGDIVDKSSITMVVMDKNKQVTANFINSNYKVEAYKVSTSAIAIDGRLDEKFWVLTSTITKSVVGNSNNLGLFGVLWDDLYLYVGILVKDSNLVYGESSQSTLWQDDSVEVYIDVAHDHKSVYDPDDTQIIKSYGVDLIWERAGRVNGLKHGWSVVDNGYAIELGIPWSNLGFTPSVGKMLGFDVGINDDDNGGDRDSQMMWCGTGQNYIDTSNFGDLLLVEVPFQQDTPPEVEIISLQNSSTVFGVTD